MYETYLQNERELDRKYTQLKAIIPPTRGWISVDAQIKSHNRLSLIKVMKVLEKELEYKECPHDSHSHCIEEECYLNEETGYNAGIRASIDKIREFISKLEQ